MEVERHMWLLCPRRWGIRHQTERLIARWRPWCSLEVEGPPASSKVSMQKTNDAHDGYHRWLGKALAEWAISDHRDRKLCSCIELRSAGLVRLCRTPCYWWGLKLRFLPSNLIWTMTQNHQKIKNNQKSSEKMHNLAHKDSEEFITMLELRSAD